MCEEKAMGLQEKEQGFYNFLSHFKVTQRNLPFTHVSLDPKGKYYIAPDALEEFLERYHEVADERIGVCVAEKPSTVSSLRADFDFKSELEGSPRRQYTPALVRQVAGFYSAEIVRATEEKDRDDRVAWALVLEKKAPRVEGAYVKDGFHLHFPHFRCEAWAAEYLQRKVMTHIRDGAVFSGIRTVHGEGSKAIERICDSIARNPWLLYGSSKALGKEPFRASYVLTERGETTTLQKLFGVELVGRPRPPLYYLPSFLSLRNSDEATPLTAAVCANKMAYVRKKKRSRAVVSPKDEARALQDLRTVKDAGFLEMLKDERADVHDDWMFVGFALYNVAQGHDLGLTMWEDFSRRSPKFVEGECAEKWQGMRLGDITMGSLIWLAKADSPDEYREWQKEDTQHLMRDSLWLQAPNELKISRVVAKLFRDRFVCANPPQNLWYEFVGHRWKVDPGGTRLKIAITGKIMDEYNDFLGHLTRRFSEADAEEDRKEIQKMQKKCTNVMAKLGTTSFLTNLVRMCQLQLFDETFLQKADENKQIFGCDNGVLDLELNTFRPGTPDDYLTFSCGFDYVDYAPDAPEVEEVNDFLEKVFPNPNIRSYFLDVSCSCLQGGNKNKKFIVNTGDTNGGKSKTIEVLEAVFGDYAINFPRELIIKGRGNSSNSPRPELARVRGRRIVTLHEVGKGESLNIGVLKAMTGNDAFFARTLHDKGAEIKPMFTLFMQCNDPPRIPENDAATWYRVRVIDYQSRFDENAPWDFDEQRRKSHYQADRNLEVAALAPALLWKLKQRFGAYKEHGLREPAEVRVSTARYKTANDIYQQFVDECWEVVPADPNGGALPFLRIGEIYSTFRYWFKENHPSYSKDCAGRPEVRAQLVKRVGAPTPAGRWEGCRLRFGEGEKEHPSRP